MDPIDLPWYVGLAPLLGWLLDAVVRAGRLDGAVSRFGQRLTARLEFAMRAGEGEEPVRGGLFLVGLLAAGGAIWAWVLLSAARIFFGPLGIFVATTAIFFLIFDTRRIATAALAVERQLLEGREEDAERGVRSLGGRAGSRDLVSLSGAGIFAVSDNLLLLLLTPILWGTLLGPIGGAAVFGVVAVVHQSRMSDEDATLWTWPERIAGWLSTPALWLGGFLLQLMSPLVGMARRDFFNALIHKRVSAPTDRLRAALVGGFKLGEDVGGPREGVAPSPSDIQRAVVLLWTSSFLLVALGTGLRCLALHLL